MKIILTFLLLVASHSLLIGQDSPRTARVIAVKANLRSAPGPSAQIVATFNRNTRLKVLNESHNAGWYFVSRGTQKGWIQGNTIKIIEAGGTSSYDELLKWASRDDWKRYASGTDGDVFFYDAGRLKRSGRSFTVWTKSMSSDAKILTKSLVEVSCTTSQYRYLSYVAYNLAGNVTAINDADRTFSYIVPDSIMEGLSDALCK